TYSGTARGENGDVTVSVTVSTDSILDISIADQQETAGIADDALSVIPREILDNQSLNVDTLTGATITSKAIIAAVSNAIAAAGASADDWQEDKTGITDQKITETSADVCVIGSGAAGLAATLRLQQLGIKVILLEKNSRLGGTLAWSDGTLAVTGSQLREDAGNTKDSAALFGQDLMVFGGSSGNADLIRMFAEYTGDTVNWMKNDLGVDFDLKKGLQSAEGNSSDRILHYDGSAEKVSDLLVSEIDVSGAKVMNNTRAIGLKKDNGRVTGVIARTTSGKIYDITAKTVVLAAGGYGSNSSLTGDAISASLYGGSPSSTGDAIILGRDEGLNVAASALSEAQYSYAGIALSNPVGVLAEAANLAAMDSGYILVNAEGKRFVSETASNSEILGAEMMQTDGTIYAVMTQEAFTQWREELEKRTDLSTEIAKWLDSDNIYKGDTIGEAADAAGIDSTILKHTADVFDHMISIEEDIEYNRDSSHLGKSFKGSSSYYIIKEQPCFYETLGGIAVNNKMQVLNREGNAIEGLYAAGESVGDVFGLRHTQSVGVTWAFVSGKRAADMIDAQTAESESSAVPSAVSTPEASASEDNG
ncbi:MAG: FAD-dependent oxidoreductase, partial [Erysipelotrichia bacterium]|nr:FAD-dependent oxidoreductase [Erysipelotrichia bacterium]